MAPIGKRRRSSAVGRLPSRRGPQRMRSATRRQKTVGVTPQKKAVRPMCKDPYTGKWDYC